METSSFIHASERVLFIGDSITDAFRKPDEVNIAFRLGNGYAMMAAAHLMASRPADDLRFKNRGISGQCLTHLVQRWQTDCLELQPTILSILIGVNDSHQFLKGNAAALSPAAWACEYKSLLERTRAALPNVRFVLCEPFALQVGDVTPERMADVRERQQLLNELADEFEAICVPLGSVFEAALEKAPPEYWLYDGIHPTAAGHWILAGAWLEAVGELGE